MAAALYGQSRVAAERAGDVVGAAIESANAAEIFIDQGRVDEARPLLNGARRVFEASDNPYLVAYVWILTGRAQMRARDYRAARESFTNSADGYAALEEASAATEATVRLAEACLADGQFAEADELIATLEGREVTGPALSRLHRHHARVARMSGDDESARVHVVASIEAPGSTPFEQALSLSLLAILDADDASRQRAVEILTGLGVVDIDSLLADEAGILASLEGHR